MHKLTNLSVTFGVFEVQDGIIISEEVDLINSKRMCVDFFDDVLDNFIAASLY